MLLGAAGEVHAITYSFTTIVDPPGFQTADALGINNAGQIVGTVHSGGLLGFLKTGDNFTFFSAGGQTSPWGINDIGNIVGTVVVENSNHGFLKTTSNTTTFEVPGAYSTMAWDINNLNQIVGTFRGPSPYDHSYVKTGPAFTTFDVPGALWTTALGINDAGVIVGAFGLDLSGSYYGFVKTGSTYTPIAVPGARSTEARGINNANQIVGTFYYSDEVLHGFVKTGSTFTIIDVPGARTVPGVGTHALGINDAGVIVGTFTSATGHHGYIATPVPTAPPMIDIIATPDTLWPPNGRLVPVTVSGTITDEDSAVGEITAAYEVIDEYGLIHRNSAVTVQSDGSYVFTVSLRASRNGTDADGRRYTITVSAHDNAGNNGSAEAIVTVPHDQEQSRAAR